MNALSLSTGDLPHLRGGGYGHCRGGCRGGAFLVGNLGSLQRFSYSAIGDTVNLAARVEGLTKQYAVTVSGGGTLAAIVMELNISGGDNAMIYGGFPAP